MVQKRKRPATRSSTAKAVAKRSKLIVTFESLPAEVVDLILFHTLPDPSQYGGSAYQLCMEDLFTSPILRVSSGLRRQGLNVIYRRSVWIYIKFDVRRIPQRLHLLISEISSVPQMFLAGFPPKHPRIDFLFRKEDEGVDIDSDDSQADAFVFPYNFDKLLFVYREIVDYITDADYEPRDIYSRFDERVRPTDLFDSGLEEEEDGDNDDRELSLTGERENKRPVIRKYYRPKVLTISVKDITSDLQRIVEGPISHSWSTWRFLNKISFQHDGVEFTPSNVGRHMCADSWSTDDFIDRAKDILQRSDEMKSMGYAIESGLMLVHSDWIQRCCMDWLPPSRSWSAGEATLDQDEGEDNDDSSEEGVWYPSRCPEGNQLSRLIRQIENGARVAFAHCLTAYGGESLVSGKAYSGHRYAMPLVESVLFGSSTSELAELHYSRALVHEMKGRLDTQFWSKGYTHPHSRPSKTKVAQSSCFPDTGLANYRPAWIHLKTAAEEMYLAKTLIPWNDEYEAKYKSYTKYLGSKQAQTVETAARKSFVIVTDKARRVQDRKVLWAGCWDLLDSWGGYQAAEERLPLAQKGLDISPTVEECVAAIPPELQTIFRRRGERCKREDPEMRSRAPWWN